MEPWEELDIDDSDLSTFVRPCNSNSISPIPGPANAIQAVMMNHLSDDPLPTQEFVKRVASKSDHEFNTNPWQWALQFNHFHGLLDGHDAEHGMPLSTIKNVERATLVTGIVKSCTPNGFGDMTITLKDPTATASANVHRKVLADPEFGKDITVGSVLVLQKVVVFRPTRVAYYLNITVHNIVKVFPKDIGPPSEELIRSARPVVRPKPSIDPNLLKRLNASAECSRQQF